MPQITRQDGDSAHRHLYRSQHQTASRGACPLPSVLRSFIHYLEDWLEPQLPSMTRRILAIPFKRHAKPMVGYLLREEIEAILAADSAP